MWVRTIPRYAAAGDQKSLLQFNDTATGTVSFGGDASDLTLHMDIDTDILIAMRELESVGILLTDAGTITGLPSSDLVAWLNQHLTFNATLESLGFGIKGWKAAASSFPAERTRDLHFVRGRFHGDGNPGP